MKKINKTILESKRLILRPFTKNDINAIFTIYSDLNVNTYLPWFTLKSLEEAQIFFERNYVENEKQSNYCKYAICLKSDNKPIGYVHINFEKANDLGYGLIKEHWGKGIVAEACKRIIKELKEMGIPYITATHDIKNLSSGMVMRKIGMTYCYSYEELWQLKNKLVIFRLYQLNLAETNHKIYKEYWNDSKVHFVELNL